MGSKTKIRNGDDIIKIGDAISNVITFLHVFYSRVTIAKKIEADEREAFENSLMKCSEDILLVQKLFRRLE